MRGAPPKGVSHSLSIQPLTERSPFFYYLTRTGYHRRARIYDWESGPSGDTIPQAAKVGCELRCAKYGVYCTRRTSAVDILAYISLFVQSLEIVYGSGMGKYVLVDGEYILLSEFQKKRKPDVKVATVINVKDTEDGMAAQHLHELTWQELRKFCREQDIKTKRTDTRPTLLAKLRNMYAERE